MWVCVSASVLGIIDDMCVIHNLTALHRATYLQAQAKKVEYVVKR